ncbi:MAG TPA: hypothetical protein DDW78_09875 [Treponema sp.]|nr:hypothetical protein [Treponema sp.]
MKKHLSVLCAMLFMALCVHAVDIKPQKGTLSKVSPVLVEKFEGTMTLQDGSEKDIEGIAFYFEISKINKKSKYFTLSELRDFFIDGKSYAQMTKESLGTDIEPDTEITDSSRLLAEEPELKKRIKDKKNGIVMKTLIYGAALPESGTVRVAVHVGWDSELEEFDFEFDIGDL